MLSVANKPIMLSVVMLNVVAPPIYTRTYWKILLTALFRCIRGEVNSAVCSSERERGREREKQREREKGWERGKDRKERENKEKRNQTKENSIRVI